MAVEKKRLQRVASRPKDVGRNVSRLRRTQEQHRLRRADRPAGRRSEVRRPEDRRREGQRTADRRSERLTRENISKALRERRENISEAWRQRRDIKQNMYPSDRQAARDIRQRVESRARSGERRDLGEITKLSSEYRERIQAARERGISDRTRGQRIMDALRHPWDLNARAARIQEKVEDRRVKSAYKDILSQRTTRQKFRDLFTRGSNRYEKRVERTLRREMKPMRSQERERTRDRRDRRRRAGEALMDAVRDGLQGTTESTSEG